MTEAHKMMRDGIKPVNLGCTCGMHRSTYNPEQRAYYNYIRKNAITMSENIRNPIKPERRLKEPTQGSYWGLVFMLATFMVWIFL